VESLNKFTPGTQPLTAAVKPRGKHVDRTKLKIIGFMAISANLVSDAPMACYHRR
jgi:hypothetical protein